MKATNTFYDINKFPKGEGILWMPISMSRISNSQNASKCFKYISKINPSKISEPKVGVNFVYTDFLYLYNGGESYEIKKQYSNLCLAHANAVKKTIKKPIPTDGGSKTFFIESAFSFTSWNQQYYDIKDFFLKLKNLRDKYDNDQEFQKYMLEDYTAGGPTKPISENQIMFYLEEHLITTLCTGLKILQHNVYAKNPARLLLCYPGPMLKHQAYILQNNLLNTGETKNPYQYCHYDLKENILYDAMNLDIDTYTYTSGR